MLRFCCGVHAVQTLTFSDKNLYTAPLIRDKFPWEQKKIKYSHIINKQCTLWHLHNIYEMQDHVLMLSDILASESGCFYYLHT